MIGTRYEEYGQLHDDLPFVLTANIERTAFNGSHEKNWHEDLEIQLCTGGRGTVLINGEIYDFSQGDIAVVDSNAIHYTTTDDQLTYTCLIVNATFCKRVGIPYDRLSFSPLIRDEMVKERIGSLTDIYRDQMVPYRLTKLNTIVLQILLLLAERYAIDTKRPTARQKVFDNVKDAMKYIRTHYAEKITLDDLAAAIYTDKFRLCRDFKKMTGHTIVSYTNRYRCHQAAEHIAEGNTVTEAALSCGFENLSFFTRTFKTYMGVLPSAYKS